jgi:hypothetical protein
MRVPIEIKKKAEEKRATIRMESERIRRDSKEKHICANCGQPLPAGRRAYCSDECVSEFTSRYDYSQSSEILKQYRADLQLQYETEHPKKEREPWTHPVAKKEHRCFVCGLVITKGEKYDRYVRLPEMDEFFDDAPYESICYHSSCQEFISRLYEVDALRDEGFTEDELYDIFQVFSWEFGISTDEIKKRIRNNQVPTVEQIQEIGEKYSWDFEIRIPIGKPLFRESVIK